MEPPLARAFAALTTGIYVLTVRDGERRHGMSSSWVTQVSGDPPLLMAAIDRRHFSHAIVERTQRFALNVLGRGGRHLEDYFYSPAARRAANLDTVNWAERRAGRPVVLDGMVTGVSGVCDRHIAGDHTLFVAAVQRVTWRADDHPLTSQDLEYVYVGEILKRKGPHP